MINGGCSFALPEPDGPGLALHTDYTGSQLAAAVSFLQAHPRQVGPITVAIGGVDAVDALERCNFESSCVEASGLADQLGQNLDHILGALRSAAPDAKIILLVFYNPFAVGQPGTNGLWQRYYSSVVKDAASRNEVEVADVARAISGRNYCLLTFLCASGDLHPTDAGYQHIAETLSRVAGLRTAG